MIKKKPFAKTKKDVQLVKDLLYPLLRNEVLEVEFRKVDGNTRKMRSTLKAMFLPPKTVYEKKAYPSTRNPNVCNVWDVKKQAWRSFRFDSVISVSVV